MSAVRLPRVERRKTAPTMLVLLLLMILGRMEQTNERFMGMLSQRR